MIGLHDLRCGAVLRDRAAELAFRVATPTRNLRSTVHHAGVAQQLARDLAATSCNVTCATGQLHNGHWQRAGLRAAVAELPLIVAPPTYDALGLERAAVARSGADLQRAVEPIDRSGARADVGLTCGVDQFSPAQHAGAAARAAVPHAAGQITCTLGAWYE